MKAIGYRACLPITDDDALVDLDLPKPQPGPRDLLVSVRAVSVNPVDVKLRAGALPPAGEARVLGFDAAGVVEAVGARVTLFRPGDEVYYAGAITRPGSNAEFQLVDERLVGGKPRSLSFTEAAALPLTSITAWELLFERLAVTRTESGPGKSLLIINGAGGVGSILIQLARRLTGLTVIATASRSETIAWCREMGAHHVIDHHASLPGQLKALDIAQVDYVASLTASDRNLPVIGEIIAPQGRLALIDDPEVLDIAPLKRKSVSVHWELMFTRSLYETPDMIAQHQLLGQVAELVDAGTLRTTLTDEAGPLTAANLRRVHALVESGRARGKTVLTGAWDR
ncbi:zinc-binding alcohol dehydrogenase family protein [Telmatospirillum siberiense]|uniref:Zinc-type alcohol dehydrogenase-like protein n=1 Tax=Telmatospirillum siberiense TaxID=382514 RepID=A0A2N3Q0U0_9PROT|nr:zinc-binding alcohol dehydrogenase family protein [Telmatospirillum siberiense]PKU26267.1 zinc-binding alcohol dehydrogenase family protein [Telmatospirillum siberiense]